MTNLLSQSDRESILKFASEQEVEINIQASLNRVLVSGEERAVEKVCNDIQRRIMNLNALLHELHMFEWLVTNRDGTEELYKAEQARQLEVAHQRKEEFVKLEIDGIKCIVNLKMMEETEDISRVTKTVYRRRKVHHDYPDTWDLSNIGKEVVSFFDVNELSDEYTAATKRFNETIGSNVIITRVQRIQNPSEYARYLSLRNTWRMLHGKGSVHEKELFHGTKRDKIEPICSTGFNRGYAADSNAARYGKGVYFALNASYSMQDK
uniref:Poly [ADP-ribose] polymerase n=1 Tax=Amphimedon queenslandica TaxID=400682 RepID=A0A1X7SHA1_AMPQE